MEEEELRKGRRLRALARVCRESGELGPLASQLLLDVEGLAAELFGSEDPEGVEPELRARIERLRRERHAVC